VRLGWFVRQGPLVFSEKFPVLQEFKHIVSRGVWSRAAKAHGRPFQNIEFNAGHKTRQKGATLMAVCLKGLFLWGKAAKADEGCA